MSREKDKKYVARRQLINYHRRRAAMGLKSESSLIELGPVPEPEVRSGWITQEDDVWVSPQDFARTVMERS